MVQIIAEAGVNHNGDINLAREMVEVAAESGADWIKFQTFSANNLLTKNAPKAEYQKKNYESLETQYEMIQRLAMNNEMHLELIDYCKKKNIKFLSSAFDIKSLKYLKSLGISTLKIPSGEITNLPYLRYVGECNFEVFLSTGMADIKEIKSAMDILEKGGTKKSNITILHCSTQYPLPITEVNLLAMVEMQKELKVSVGYSDHTIGLEVPIAAVALGAKVVEKHFTLNRNMSGPDHLASLEPNQLKSMVKSIRNIEKSLGSSFKRPSAEEIKNKKIVRKSIVAQKKINVGEMLTEENLAVKRPGTGISPMRWDEVIGRKANRNFNEDELIEI